jgi:very-short-patch-repair endonuclease
MTKLYIITGAIFAVGFILTALKGSAGRSGKKERQVYQYSSKKFFLTRAEHECYDALIAAVGEEYHVFPQVHLPSIVDNKVIGQHWKAAFSHISQKSVDFVLCDKSYISPKLAIELDDRTHERPDRRERDIEVERILEDAGLPLLRLENHGAFHPTELAQKIADALKHS